VNSSSDFSSWIAEWRDDLLRGSTTDPLLNISPDEERFFSLEQEEVIQFVLPINAKSKKLIKEHQEFYKNAGINVLCLVREVLEWWADQNFRCTPITLSTCSYEVDKVNGQIRFEASQECFLNPFLPKIFAQKFGVNFSDWLDRGILPDHWRRRKVQILGNFHYHRFVLLRDFDDYRQNEKSVDSLLGYYLQQRERPTADSKQKSEHFIYPMDSDQKAAFDKVVSGIDLVIEGAPGSGKSQVLTNLLFHAARTWKNALLCSEKKTALKVIESKLVNRGLGSFCQYVDDEAQFIGGLLKTWNELELKSADEKANDNDFDLYPQKLAALTLKLERLAQFPRLAAELQNPPFELPYYSDWTAYQKYKGKLLGLNESYLLLTGETLDKSGFAYVKSFVYRDAYILRSFIDQAREHHHFLQKFNADYADFIPMYNLNDLEQIQRKLVYATILNQDLFLKNEALFDADSKVFKKFHKTYKLYLVCRQTIELHKSKHGFKWEKPWSQEELFMAKKSFASDKIWSLRYRRWKKRFNESYRPEVFSRELAIRAIDSCLEMHKVSEELNECLMEFQKLGIHHPEVDLPIVLQMQRAVKQNLFGIHKMRKEFNREQLHVLLENEKQLRDLYRFVSHHFSIPENQSLLFCFGTILKEQQFLLGQYSSIAELLNLEPSLYKFLPYISDFNRLDQVMQWGAIQQFENRNPELFHYSAQDLNRDIERLIEDENRYFDHEVKALWKERTRRFIAYHRLITAPESKLNAEQKIFRRKLKTGRSILIKEFNKTRQFKSIRELLESEAAPWIELLKPILLLNPLMISKVLPNEKQSVDLILFDEASQIPFSHAIPTLYRAKQVAIFGDSNQLSPSTFFVQGESRRADLLTQSRYFLPFAELRYHYRSRHGSLIAYANRYFYNNELKILPSKSDERRDGVFCHFIANGIYDSGENEVEARALIQFLQRHIHLWPSYESIGIVAFSEKQLARIEQELLASHSRALMDKWDQDQLVLNTVEKIQGEEYDIILISLGYAKDKNGVFSLRFGPLNQEGGEKRLNVIFSRARRALHFFHSVTAQDFGLSENMGVQALKNFLLMHENRNFQASNNGASSNNDSTYEIIDPFYRVDAVRYLMTLKRHAYLSGLNINIRFFKDALERT
jgi:hypothetical protein